MKSSHGDERYGQYGDERYGQYGGGDSEHDYDQKNMMMIDKKY